MRIYLDTSVINGLFACDAPHIETITKDFFNNTQRGIYTMYVSDLAAEEINRTVDRELKRKLVAVFDNYDFEILPTTEEARALADIYIKARAIPSKYLPDALHIANATVHNIPVLVSWNFEHIVKHTTRIKVNRVNAEQGYPPIDICSPEEV